MDPAPTTMYPDQTTPDPTTLDFLHVCSFFYLSPNVFIKACKITASSLLSFCEKQQRLSFIVKDSEKVLETLRAPFTFWPKNIALGEGRKGNEKEVRTYRESGWFSWSLKSPVLSEEKFQIWWQRRKLQSTSFGKIFFQSIWENVTKDREWFVVVGRLIMIY